MCVYITLYNLQNYIINKINKLIYIYMNNI